MQKTLYLLSVILIPLFSAGQTPVLSFDGIDDYVDLGTNAGNNVRTVEFWFRLNQPIDSTLSAFKMICSREVSSVNDNEWHVSFTQTGSSTTSGTIRFAIVESLTNVYDVVSDNNSWNAGQWYHVAGVVDSVQGMMLFINGQKQMDAIPSFTNSTAVMSNNTEIGRQSGFSRHFEGKLDDFHLSQSALYTSNFTPACPNRMKESSTIGLWNFNENTGSTAIDSSLNNYNAQIYGATWDTSFICQSVGIANLPRVNNALTIYPNPSLSRFNIQTNDPNLFVEQILVFNSLGQIIIDRSMESSNFEIDFTNHTEGLYHYIAKTSENNIQSGTLIKK